MRTVRSIAIVLGMVLAMSVHAEESDRSFGKGVYFGVGVAQWIFTMDEGSIGSTAVAMKAGVRVNDNFAVEGRFMAGGSDDLYGVEVELERSLSILAKIGGSIAEGTRVDFVAGATNGTFAYSADVYGYQFAGNDDATELSVGLGLESKLSKHIGLFVDYTAHHISEEYTVHGPSAGITAYF